MTPRSLFNIILKIIGILFIKDAVMTMPQFFPAFLYIEGNGAFIFFSFLALAVYAVGAYYLIVKSDLIIEKLNLDGDLGKESIAISIQRSTVLTISLIVIGGLLVISTIPAFLRHLYICYEHAQLNYGKNTNDLKYISTDIVKIVIGLLFIGERKRIVNYIEHLLK